MNEYKLFESKSKFITQHTYKRNLSAIILIKVLRGLRTRIKKFIIISIDDIAIVLFIIALSYYLARQYFYIIAIVASTSLITFLVIKYKLLYIVLDDKPKINYNLVNKKGIVIKDLNPEGLIKINGEIWKARSIKNETIEKGKEVIVIRRKNLLLLVDKK